MRPQNHLKSVTYLTLIIFTSKLYVDELKGLINSERAALGRALLNTLLVSYINVYRLRSRWRTF